MRMYRHYQYNTAFSKYLHNTFVYESDCTGLKASAQPTTPAFLNLHTRIRILRAWYQDYGHQVVSVMLSCNGIILNYAVILYDRSKSKIQIVQEIAQELPVAPVVSYFLCDSWYTSVKVMDSFIQKGFYTIGALKTNRIIYPFGIRQKSQRFCPSFTKNRYGRQPCDRWRT